MKISDIKSNSQVFVRNLTKTDINVTVTDSKGHPSLLIIARSSIPQEVTEVISADVLKKDTEFKTLVARGIINLVDPKKAKEELDTPEGKIQAAHLRKTKFSLPKELLASEDELNLSPTDVINSGSIDSVRIELRDLVINEELDPNDLYANLLTYDKEEPLTREEMEFVLSSINEKVYFDAYEFIKGKRNSFLNNLD